MTTLVRNRLNGWTPEEDTLLAETVIKYIRTGKTQLEAFDVIGKRLRRTSSAVGFRWNGFVRHQHISDVNLAKQQRKDNRSRLAEKRLQKMQEVSEQMIFELTPSSVSSIERQEEKAMIVVEKNEENPSGIYQAVAKILRDYGILEQEVITLREENAKLKERK